MYVLLGPFSTSPDYRFTYLVLPKTSSSLDSVDFRPTLFVFSAFVIQQNIAEEGKGKERCNGFD